MVPGQMPPQTVVIVTCRTQLQFFNLQKPLQHLPQAYLDHYTFQGNSPPTPPPPKPTLTITSHLGQNAALGEGYLGG